MPFCTFQLRNTLLLLLILFYCLLQDVLFLRIESIRPTCSSMMCWYLHLYSQNTQEKKYYKTIIISKAQTLSIPKVLISTAELSEFDKTEDESQSFQQRKALMNRIRRSSKFSDALNSVPVSNALVSSSNIICPERDDYA